MSSQNIQLVGGTLQVLDTTVTPNVYRLSSIIADIVAQGNESSYFAGLLVGAAPVTVPLPAATIFVLYIRNLHATQTLTVTATPAGGSSAVLGTLNPGAVLIVWTPYATAPGAGGYTVVSLTASGANTPAEVLVGA